MGISKSLDKVFRESASPRLWILVLEPSFGKSFDKCGHTDSGWAKVDFDIFFNVSSL